MDSQIRFEEQNSLIDMLKAAIKTGNKMNVKFNRVWTGEETMISIENSNAWVPAPPDLKNSRKWRDVQFSIFNEPEGMVMIRRKNEEAWEYEEFNKKTRFTTEKRVMSLGVFRAGALYGIPKEYSQGSEFILSYRDGNSKNDDGANVFFCSKRNLQGTVRASSEIKRPRKSENENAGDLLSGSKGETKTHGTTHILAKRVKLDLYNGEEKKTYVFDSHSAFIGQSQTILDLSKPIGRYKVRKAIREKLRVQMGINRSYTLEEI